MPSSNRPNLTIAIPTVNSTRKPQIVGTYLMPSSNSMTPQANQPTASNKAARPSSLTKDPFITENMQDIPLDNLPPPPPYTKPKRSAPPARPHPPQRTTPECHTTDPRLDEIARDFNAISSRSWRSKKNKTRKEMVYTCIWYGIPVVAVIGFGCLMVKMFKGKNNASI